MPFFEEDKYATVISKESFEKKLSKLHKENQNIDRMKTPSSRVIQSVSIYCWKEDSQIQVADKKDERTEDE